MKPKRFTGSLELNGKSVPVKFSVEISNRGEAKLSMDRMPWDSSTKFIVDAYYAQPSAQRFFDFTLIGQARDGSTFHSTSVVFNSLGSSFSDTAPAAIKPAPWCSECKITLPGPPESTPSVKAHLRGFDSIHVATEECRLGTVELRAPMTLKKSEKELLTGALVITGALEAEPASWREKVDELFKHIRSVMSFARGARILAPVLEREWSGHRELTVRAMTSQSGNWPGAFTHFDYVPIFRQAVASHFFEIERAKTISIAIEWFTMPSGYREAKLTSAMTVLENLLTANLSKRDLYVRNDNQFKKLRDSLLDAARTKLRELGVSEEVAEDETKTMCAKLADLNRRTLKDKIEILARRWGVPLDGITDEALSEAKRARDHIVHQGQYVTDDPNELLTHIRLTRELVVRFILAALEFEGMYTSPMCGEGKREFKRLPLETN